MTPAGRRVLLAGNHITDHFVLVPEGGDRSAYAVPPPGPPHGRREEVEAIAATLPVGGRTVLAGGAPGNVGRVLSQLGVESRVAAASATRAPGLSVTWFTPGRDAPLALRVAPPQPIDAEGWGGVAAELDASTIFYLDGYAAPSLLTIAGGAALRTIVRSGAHVIWDLAHPAVVAAHRDAIRAAVGRFGEARADGTGGGLTLFATAEEVALLGGIDALRPGQGDVDLVLKESPDGATLYRLGGERIVERARFRGEVVVPHEATGIGDAFVAGYIAAMIAAPDGDDAGRRLARAHDAARRCALAVGGTLHVAAVPGGPPTDRRATSAHSQHPASTLP